MNPGTTTLRYVSSGEPVQRGDVLHDFHGEPWYFLRVVELPSPGRSGKVEVSKQQQIDERFDTRTFYPFVFRGVGFLHDAPPAA